jgi:hypothetical protein
MKMTNDDQCHRSSFGCHVAVGDVAPAIGVRKEIGGRERTEDQKNEKMNDELTSSFIIWLPRCRQRRGTCMRIHTTKTTNDDISHHSSLGCHVDVGDVAPAIGVREENGGGERGVMTYPIVNDHERRCALFFRLPRLLPCVTWGCGIGLGR